MKKTNDNLCRLEAVGNKGGDLFSSGSRIDTVNTQGQLLSKTISQMLSI